MDSGRYPYRNLQINDGRQAVASADGIRLTAASIGERAVRRTRAKPFPECRRRSGRRVSGTQWSERGGFWSSFCQRGSVATERSKSSMRGTGFEPEGDGRPRFARPLRLPGFESTLLSRSVPPVPRSNARGRIRTDGPLRDSVLSATPLAWLGNPRADERIRKPAMKLSLPGDLYAGAR